ncbi:Hypothetical protein EUBREC_2645 [Agathobacter rectalis ATCC 33656]|jgi:hypothetical protein|uniref:Uncharacterized protein n=1 Tax=Agathobacter rectalis (strain ATCC 33656 / DSM 3377 / JCM 17463 / KCTC 5835 / VPI 0990) TaxID=515619 RepID=C4ZGV4_AGARV|nr:Hypothetical protein EUBREC_2645 [Agathobacter rectalis ATCC 33656]
MPKNGKILRKLGASIFDAGTSSVFKGDVSDYTDNIINFRKNIDIR